MKSIFQSIFQYKNRIVKNRIIKNRIVFKVLRAMICLMILAQIRIVLAQDSSVISFSIPVNIDSAAVYAGPGINYYKTSVLTRGETVEVFLRNAEGWCAVRPPEGSFSWINAKFVRKNADNVGTIISDSQGKEVPVRVGGPSIMKSSVIQVGMTNGKLVKILGEMSLPGGTNWYKISPPPGEFRWIHEKSLMQDETIAKLPTQLTLARKNLGSMSEGSSVTNSDQNGVTTSALPSLDASGNNKSGNASALPNITGKSVETSSLNSPLNSASDLTAPGSKSTEEFYKELSGLNNEFFNAVNKGSSDAFYQDLSDRSAFLFQSAKNNEQRAAVKQLYDNIETQRKLGQNGNVTNESPSGNSDLDNVSFQSGNSANTRRNTNGNNSETSRLGRMEFAFSGRNSNGFGNIFRRPSKNPSDNGNGNVYNSGNNGTVNRTNNGGFTSNDISGFPQNSASGQGQFSGSHSGGTSRNYNRNFWGTATPNLVPPPSYTPVETMAVPEGAKNLPSENREGARVRPSVPELTDSLFAMVDDPASEKNTSYFKSSDSGRIKQVAAEMTSSVSDAEKNVTKWRVPSTGQFVTDSASGSGSSVISNFQQYHTKKQTSHFGQSGQSGQSRNQMRSQTQNDLSQTSQKIVEDAVRNKTFDAIGRLGYFPNPPEGCPPYVLVRQVNGTSRIVCYLTTESGQKLDQFVGQTIGIKGKKGVIRRGNETKPYFCAQTIFSIK